MGQWHKVSGPLKSPFPGLYLYGTAISPEMVDAVAALRDSLNLCSARFYLTVHDGKFFLAISSKIPVSICRESKNLRTIMDFRDRVQAILPSLITLRNAVGR